MDEYGCVVTDKEKIVELFNTNVRGKVPDLTGMNIGHDGGAPLLSLIKIALVSLFIWNGFLKYPVIYPEF